MRYFSGEAHDLGHVSALPQTCFRDLLAAIAPGCPIEMTRGRFALLPRRDRKAPLDQDRAKRVRFIVPAAFDGSPCPRRTEHAVCCNLIALDIDHPREAARLVGANWGQLLGEYGYAVWHTASSTAEAPRLRVLVAAQGIPVARYADAVRAVAELIGLGTITPESRVAVQPMYLPTIFADDDPDRSPLIDCGRSDDGITLAELFSDESAAPEAAPPSDVADLQFFCSPLEDVTLDDVRDALAHLDPDMPMHPWIEMAAGIKHQFDTPEGYALWDEWSARGKKYDGPEESRYRWDSLKARPTDRLPVTIRTVFHAAQARGWVNRGVAQRQHAAVSAWLTAPARSSEELLDDGAKRIAKVLPTLDPLHRKALMVTLRDTLRSRDIALSLSDVKQAVRQFAGRSSQTGAPPGWVQGLCYVTSRNVFYRSATHRQFAPEVLDLVYGTCQSGEEKPIRARDFAVRVANIPQVENLRYEPAQGAQHYFKVGGIPYVNTYRADYARPDPARAEEAGEVYLAHVSALLKDESYRHLLTDFLAYLVQHPGRKVRWAPLVQGGEGCGKSTLAEMMKVCLGRSNVGKIAGVDVVSGNFNDWAYGRQLLAIEEVRIVGTNRHAVMDRLKPLITDDEIGLNRKHEHHQTVANNCNYLLLTNHHDSIAIRDDSRRYFILRSALQTAEDIAAIGGAAHFARVYRTIRENPGGLRSWFERWPIGPDFDPEGRAPITPYMAELAELSRSPLQQAVREVIEDEPYPLLRRDLLSLNVLRASLDGSQLGGFSDQALAAILRELGWAKHGRALVAGARHQLWSKGAVADVRRTAQLRAELL